MKCLELFSSFKLAEKYVDSYLNYPGADAEIIETEEWDDNLNINLIVFAVYYNPPKMK